MRKSEETLKVFTVTGTSPFKTLSRQLSRLAFLRTTIGAGVLLLMALSLALGPLAASVAQKRAASEASSLPEATAAGIQTDKSSALQIDLSSAEPEGGACNWAASTVYPITILDQATVSHGGFLYTFGGVSTAIIANAYKFDGTTWTPIAPLPAALEFPTAVSDGTFIYILGGALIGTGTPQTTVYRYDPVANSYMTMAPFTTGTWNQAVAYLNGKIYKFAGTGPATASTNVLEIYDVAGNSWTQGAAYPLLISFVSAFVQGGFVYGAGGIQSVGSLASLKTYRYDPGTNQWDDAAISDLPLTRWGAASSAVGYGSNNGWVLAGGYVNGVATANISTSTIRWNPISNSWADLPPMLGERSRMTGGILGASFYVIGGRSIASSGFVGTNNNQRLTCVSGVAVIDAGAAGIVAESCGTPNGAPDPGETLTVSLGVTNSGDTATTNLTGTLQATGGVTNPGPPQNYGAVLPGGPAVSRNFTFTVDPNLACGAVVTLTFTFADGATNYPNATRNFTTGVRTLTLSENFDGVTAPALPAGWVNTQTSGTLISWTTSTTTPFSSPNAAFANDPVGVNAATLKSPTVAIAATDAQLSFKNKYITEPTFDGMVLEYSTDGGGTWTDVITGGGSFVSGGYNGAISTGFMSPIGGRQAWSGTSAGGYIDTVVNLPASLNGQMVSFRWLMASDSSVAATGVWVDDVRILGARVCSTCGGGADKPVADFDGDGKTDLSVFRSGTWYIQRSTAGFIGVGFGLASDRVAPGDFDGDGKADIAVFRTNTWYILKSTDSTMLTVPWGASGDLPRAADYDGDGKADVAVYRPGTNTFYVLRSSDSGVTAQNWGTSGDVAMAADFDGDHKADFAVFRSGTWYILGSTAGFSATPFGSAGDKPVPADYDGDNKADIAVFRTGTWYLLQSTAGFLTVPFGIGSDYPVPGDYDGDNKDDIAVFRSSGGTWYVLGSTAGFSATPFGTSGDYAVPAAYIPE